MINKECHCEGENKNCSCKHEERYVSYKEYEDLLHNVSMLQRQIEDLTTKLTTLYYRLDNEL
jgi:hypothetical protein